MLRSARRRITAYVCLLTAAFLVHACGDSTSPTVRIPVTLIVSNSAFIGNASSGVVTLAKAHVVVQHADATTALDTVITLPAASAERVSAAGDSRVASQTATGGQITLTFKVPLERSTPAAGEDLTFNVQLLDASGNVEFRAGPTILHGSSASPPAPATMTAVFAGTGAAAASVQINPPSATVLPGGNVDLVATALDANGVAIPGTPIEWTSADATVATVPNPAQGHVVAGNARGTTHIHAALLNGLSADASLVVQPAASAMALQSGNNQTGTAGSALGQPLVVKVTAADGIGVSGLPVTFAITSGGGSLAPAQVTTDANGLASVTLTLSATAGAATVTATAAGLTGSPITFSATGAAGAATVLVFTAQPLNNLAEGTLAPIVVEARDALGNRATAYTGTVSLAFDVPPTGVTLEGTTSVAAVNGVATFGAVRVSGPITSLSLRATGTQGVLSALSAPFTITGGVASRLVLTLVPTEGFFGQPMHFVIEAHTAQGALATDFAGSLSAALLAQPPGGTITHTASAGFVSGVAGLDITVSVAGTYVFDISTPSLPEVISSPVVVVVPQIQLVSGDAQSGPANTPLAQSLVARTVDATGTPVAGVAVTWSIIAGSGLLTGVTAVSDANGLVSAVWTLGSIGAQTAQVQVGTTGPTVQFTATIITMFEITSDFVPLVNAHARHVSPQMRPHSR